MSCRTVCAIASHSKSKTNTNPNPDPNDRPYRRHCPDPNARTQKFIHYMAWIVLQNSMQTEFAHTHLHTTHFEYCIASTVTRNIDFSEFLTVQ